VIELSLGTTDRKVACIRCFEELAKIERAWSGIDASIDGEGRVLATLRCKSVSDTGPAGTLAAGDDPAKTDPSKVDHALIVRPRSTPPQLSMCFYGNQPSWWPASCRPAASRSSFSLRMFH
jgi:hypothetical protein